MSNPRAWLTPETAPAQTKCWRVFVPDGEKWQSAFRGAMALLGMAENWEQFGTLTPEEAAQEFIDANFLTYEMRLCMPIGSVIFGGWNNAPEGFLLCDGASYSTTTYADLFAEIGYKFGGSGGSFNVPNTANKLPIGKSGTKAIGATGGSATHTLSEGEMPAHTHSLNETVVPGAPGAPTPLIGFNAFPALQTNSAGGGLAHNNMPPYLALNAAIAYR